MPKLAMPDDFEGLQDYVRSLFDTIPTKLMVDDAQQQQEITLLRETIGGGRFFFVVDLVNFEITFSYGVQRWLGYHEKEFTLKQYWNIVHPGKQKALMAVAFQLYNAVCKGQYALQYMVQRYSSQVALRHYNGQYLLFQKISSVFQYDAQNCLTAYMNEFTRLGHYENEPLRPVFFNSGGEEETKRGGEVLQKTIQHFLGMKVFSPNELQVARIIAYIPSIKQAAIATQLQVSPHTIDTYCKRFLNKARDYFHADFPSVVDAAVYLKREGLV